MDCESEAYLVVIRTICRFFDASVLSLITYLHANHGIHVQTRQLSCFDNGDANLIILRLQRGLSRVGGL